MTRLVGVGMGMPIDDGDGQDGPPDQDGPHDGDTNSRGEVYNAKCGCWALPNEKNPTTVDTREVTTTPPQIELLGMQVYTSLRDFGNKPGGNLLVANVVGGAAAAATVACLNPACGTLVFAGAAYFGVKDPIKKWGDEHLKNKDLNVLYQYYRFEKWAWSHVF